MSKYTRSSGMGGGLLAGFFILAMLKPGIALIVFLIVLCIVAPELAAIIIFLIVLAVLGGLIYGQNPQSKEK